jgi:CheY-like chemotaxis protein
VSKTLLAVDDSVTMRKVLEITFSSEDYRVISAESTQAALAKLGEQPKVFVIDTVLGGDDGYALAKEVRKRDASATIVLLSSRHNPYDPAKGKDAGADDFMDKPFDTQQMMDKVRKAVQARETGAAPAVQTAAPVAGARPPVAHAAPFDPGPPSASDTIVGVGPFGATPPGIGRPAPAPAATRPVAAATPAAPPVAAAKPVAAKPAAAAPPTFAAPAKAPVPAVAAARPAPAFGGTTQQSPGAPKPAQHAAPAAAVHPAPAAHAAPAPAAHAAPAPASQAAPVAPVAAKVAGQMASKLGDLGLTAAQVDAVLALSREVVERVVWEIVPELAETLIKEEIARLTRS